MNIAEKENFMQKQDINTGAYIHNLIRKVTGPMKIVGGAAMGKREELHTEEGRRFTPPSPTLLGDDAILLEKTKHVRLKDEQLMQFYSRTGLGPAQIRTMSKGEITKFVATVSAHEPTVVIPQSKTTPSRFVISD